MSLHPEPIDPVPDETARIAHAAFPRGNTNVQMRDVLGVMYDDATFADLFSTRGRSAEAPWRLALVTVMQFAEGLSDRQAAEAVRARIDWKYALGLELTDPGFDFSVLSEFRTRLADNAAEHRLLDALLAACKERGYLKARGRQRTDSTHVLGSLRVLNRLELVSETLRAALNAVAEVAPDWLRTEVPAVWFERYGRRIEDFRLPKGKEARQEYAELVGRDGMQFLEMLWSPAAPAHLRHLHAVDLLRRLWIVHYVMTEGQIRLREPKDMPPASRQIESPYEPEAHFATKRGKSWVGDKAHLTETCDDDLPHLVVNVETTVAGEHDVNRIAPIHEALARAGLLPAQHLVDAGYMRARNIVESRDNHGVDLLGPVAADHQWQAKTEEAFDITTFNVDWSRRIAMCPRGKSSIRWCETRTARGRVMIHIDFSPDDCTPCPVRSLCTRAKEIPRTLTLQVREEHEAIQRARQRQTTGEFTTAYARRAGIEGTMSQGVRAFGLRQARYRGLAKVHLQDVATASAMNVARIDDWLTNVPLAQTRCSRFAALAHLN